VDPGFSFAGGTGWPELVGRLGEAPAICIQRSNVERLMVWLSTVATES